MQYDGNSDFEESVFARSGTWKTCSHSENVEKFVVAKDEDLGANLELVFQYDGNVDFEEPVLARTGIWKTCSHSENVEKLFVASLCKFGGGLPVHRCLDANS